LCLFTQPSSAALDDKLTPLFTREEAEAMVEIHNFLLKASSYP
jgi:hypothetical protein